jgi:P27 family predicted phage terminase small subunit
MLKILQGNPGKRALNQNEPQPTPVDLPQPPKHLRKLAKEAWHDLTPELCRSRLLTILDLKLFELFCEEYAEYRKACAFIEERGEYYPIKNQKGEVHDIRQYPAVSQRTNSIASMGRLAAHLGLSPAARSRIEIPETQLKSLLP